MHHRPPRCWTWAAVSATTWERLNPQPRSTARIARSRRPLVVVESGVFSNVWACFTEGQLPKLTPFDAIPFTRVMPVSQFRPQRPVVRRFDSKVSHRGDPHVDGNGAKPAGL